MKNLRTCALAALFVVQTAAAASFKQDIVFRYTDPKAKQVTIAGDFTHFSPMPMTRDRRGEWTIHFKLKPEEYLYDFYVDGVRVHDPAANRIRHYGDNESSVLIVAPHAEKVAQERAAQRVIFAPGQSSIILKNSVVRGTRDRYLLAAKAGQTLSMRMTSMEHNACFSIAPPAGGYLPGASAKNCAETWSGQLPASGDYLIEAGSSRGNATCTLTIAIQ